MTELNFAILAVGHPGEGGVRSLKSILNLNPKKICLMLDKNGTTWINNSTTLQEKKILCLHQIDKKTIIELGFTETLGNFHDYGEKMFMKLTSLKWRIISEVIEKHKGSPFVIFTDLDVIWFKQPKISKLDKHTVWLQDDSKLNSPGNYYCTGIMFWPRNIKSINYCAELYELQNKINRGLHYVHDEQVFNKYIKELNTKLKAAPLEKSYYLIGHKARKLLFQEANLLENAIAFHANYFKGANVKNLVMKSIQSKITHNGFWLYGLIKIYLHLILVRIKSYR